MRIIAGMARGRKLREPSGVAIRPTTDMVKESIFNIVQFDVEGRAVLDLFAGTGQLGIEALSRGAVRVTFVDESLEALKLVKKNIELAGFSDNTDIVRSDALEFLNRGTRYDLIFLDPPYNSGLLEKALKAINQFDILKDNGIIVCESKVGKVMPELSAPYEKRKEYRYGTVKITLYVRIAE